MTSIGSLVFCSDCGNLLDENENREDAILKCDMCGALCKDTSQKKIKTESKPSAYPSSLRAKRSEVQQMTDESRPAQATITQTCEKCGRTEVQWYEQQLRGADEGSTIFYICDCGNKYVYNAFLREITANRFTQMDPKQLIAQCIFVHMCLVLTKQPTHCVRLPESRHNLSARSSRIRPYPMQ
jgi:DNA-directed RNA polymerase I subunit RPA12